MTGYTYQFDDSAIDQFDEILENRLGDNSGVHEQDFFDVLSMLMAINSGGACLDVGAGVGRITAVAREAVRKVVALEPDEIRWKACRDAWHRDEDCEVLCQTTEGFIQDNPGTKFDLIVVSMVLQHLSTDSCRALLHDITQLLSVGGTAIISTTHTIEACRGFSFSGDPERVYLDKEEFNVYAEMPTSERNKGLPVRRFSRNELNAEVEAAGMRAILWRQISYYKPNGAAFFSKRLGVSAEELKDCGNSQYIVVQKN